MSITDNLIQRLAEKDEDIARLTNALKERDEQLKEVLRICHSMNNTNDMRKDYEDKLKAHYLKIYQADGREIAKLREENAELKERIECARIKLNVWRNIFPEKLECDADIVETLAILEEANPQPEGLEPSKTEQPEKKEGNRA